MKGNVLNYDITLKSGLISGADGNRYTFSVDDWKSQMEIRSGRNVDFDIVDKTATDIFPDSKSVTGGSQKIPAALLAFFLGAFGAHKFYLGYKTQGFIMLLVFIFGFILLGIPSMIIGLIAFVEFIIYIIKSDEEFENTYVIGEKKWF